MQPAIRLFCGALAATPLALSGQTTHTFTAAGSKTNDGSPATDKYHWGDPANWDASGVPNSAASTALFNLTTGGREARFVAADGTTPATTDVNILSFTGTPTAALVLHPKAGTPALGGINFTGTTPTVNNATGQSIFYYANITGSGGITKTGNGRFTLRFNAIDHAYTGDIVINGGTFGINQNGSLGDPNNDIRIADQAKLLCEPGSNTGTIALPATRSIVLTGTAPQLGASDPRINMIIEGDISDAGGGFGPNKTDNGIVTLAGTNTWTGTTLVTAGVLVAAKPASLPGYASQTYNVNGTSTLAVRFGDAAGSWTAAETADLLNNASFAANARFGIDTTGNTATANFPGDIAAGNFTKVGPGTLVLDAEQTTIASVNLFGGTLELGPSGGLPAGQTIRSLIANSTLNLGGKAVSAVDIQEFGGATTTIANGSLTAEGATVDLAVSGANNTKLDLGGLSSFAFNNPTLKLQVNPVSTGAVTLNDLLLAKDGSNTVTALNLEVGTGGGNNDVAGTQGRLYLGQTNTFNVTNLYTGGYRAGSVVQFQAGLANPTLKIRATDGTSPAPLLRIGHINSGGGAQTNVFDLTGGSLDAKVVSAVVGQHISGANNAVTATLTMPDGSFEATTLTLADKLNAGSPLVNATFAQGGGTVTVDTILMGQTAAGGTAASPVQYLRPTYTLGGGTLAVTEIKPGPLGTPLAPLAQVETATATGTAAASGNVNVTVTGAGIAGSPLTIPVAVAAGDTNAAWAAKVQAALAADPAVGALYTVTNNNNLIVLTRKEPGVYDGTLNVALANGTPSPGITAAANSANTNANVLSNVIRSLNLNGGTLSNKDGADLTVGGVTVNVPVGSTAAVDSTAGRKVVIGSDVTYAARIDSATAPSASVGTLQVDGDVELAGTLAVTDNATAAVQIPGGTKLVLIDYRDGSLTGTFNGLADGATVTVAKGAVTNTFVLDYNDPAYAGKAVTLTTQAAGFADWANANGIPGASFGDDSDGDGLDNGTEYAIGSNPALPTPHAPLVPAGSGWTLTYPKGTQAAADSGIAYRFETSPDLVNWTETAPTAEDATWFSYTLVRDTAQKFVRVKIKQLP